MFDKASVEHEAPERAKPPQSGFRRVAGDIVDLIELQGQLLALDGKVASKRFGAASVLSAVAGVIAVGVLTVLMIACGQLLHEYAEWSLGWSLMLAAGVGLVIAGILAVIALSLMKSAAAALQESSSEFKENVRWVKSILLDPESLRNQVRPDPRDADYYAFGGRMRRP